MIFQIADRVADHAEIFIRLGAQRLGDVQQPRRPTMVTTGVFASRIRRMSSSCSTATPLRRVMLNAAAICAFETFALGRLLEELHVLPDCCPASRANVLEPRKNRASRQQSLSTARIDAFALRPIAQSRIVNFDLRFH